MKAERIVDLGPRHQNSCVSDARGVARKLSHSEGVCNSTPLNVGNGVVGQTPRHRELCTTDAYGVELKKYPRIERGCHIIPLSVGIGIVGENQGI